MASTSSAVLSATGPGALGIKTPEASPAARERPEPRLRHPAEHGRWTPRG